jgi:hypothetical protein
MDILVLAVQIAALVLLLYGVALCAWITFTDGSRRAKLRLVSELAEPAKQPRDAVASEIKKAA